MKKVEAILSPGAFDSVRNLLVSQGGYEIVVSEVKSAQNNTIRSLRYRRVDYEDEVPRLKLETVVADQDAMQVAHVILTSAQNHDSPMVSVCPVETVFWIGISKIDEKTNPARTNVIEIGRKPAREPARYARSSGTSPSVHP